MSKPKKNKTNAVLYKEMTIDMKRPKIMIIMLLINLFLVPISFGFFLGIMFSSVEATCSYRVLAWYLIAMVFVESTLLLFLTPAITAGSISLEKERQTLDVLLTTRMTPWEIIKGKYGSDFIFLSLMVISTFPLLAIVFIYGGISFFQLLYIGLALLVFIGFISCFGIFFSTLTKNTIVSVILTYLFIMIYFSVTFSVPWVIQMIIAMINESLYYDKNMFAWITDPHFINGDFLMLLGTFNPILMIFDVLGNTMGYNFGDYTSIKGMISLCGTDVLPHFTEKNILMKLWTPISMVEMVLISLGVLRLSAAILNPVKGKNKQKKKTVSTVKQQQ
ncbi:MAG: ABC transporter permease [Lachnospiraceae bacterium]|nr:ABC transporter permease [Lachnospiraceae bacterium]